MKFHSKIWSVPILAGLLAAAGCADEQAPTAPAVNLAPTAVIAANLTEILEGDGNTTVITISGTSSTDPNGDALTYIWSIPGATYENGTNSSDGIILVSFAGTAVELVNLVVRDPEGLSDAAQITITLRPGPNNPPTAELSVSPETIPFGDGNTTVISLGASASFDIDGDLISFEWTVPGGTFVGGTDANSEVAQVTLPGTGPSNVTLEVTDSKGLTDTASFTIRSI
jgi:chitinase